MVGLELDLRKWGDVVVLRVVSRSSVRVCCYHPLNSIEILRLRKYQPEALASGLPLKNQAKLAGVFGKHWMQPRFWLLSELSTPKGAGYEAETHNAEADARSQSIPKLDAANLPIYDE